MFLNFQVPGGKSDNYFIVYSFIRKRMSIIFKDEDDSIKIYSKGADSIIYKRMRKLK